MDQLRAAVAWSTPIVSRNKPLPYAGMCILRTLASPSRAGLDEPLF